MVQVEYPCAAVSSSLQDDFIGRVPSSAPTMLAQAAPPPTK
jgi:hypothetical protein